MDEMRIVSKFTRGIISKAIKMVIRKKTGYNIDIQLNEAITTINDGKTHLLCHIGKVPLMCRPTDFRLDRYSMK